MRDEGLEVLMNVEEREGGLDCQYLMKFCGAIACNCILGK